MKILVDINHPAHVHYFRNCIKILEQKGHEFIVVSRDKDVAHQLLHAYKIPFIDRKKGGQTFLQKFFYLFFADYKLFKIAKQFKPDLFLSFLHPYPAHIAYILGKPHLAFSDTEQAVWHHKFTVPFATNIFTPACFEKFFEKKHFKFNGYMELAALHPHYFSPDNQVFEMLGLKNNESFTLLRFVSKNAVHASRSNIFDSNTILNIINIFSPYGKVFISSEEALPEQLQPYHLNIPVHKIHSVIYYASLLFGESATMTSEAAILGTPAIFLDNKGRSYTTEQQQKYQTVWNFECNQKQLENAISKGLAILQHPETKAFARSQAQKLLSEHIDLTKWMVWLVENYPQSIKVLKDNPSFQP